MSVPQEPGCFYRKQRNSIKAALINSPLCEQGNPGKTWVMTINEHILDKQVRRATMLQGDCVHGYRWHTCT